MQTFILRGKLPDQEGFVENFIKENKIASYNLIKHTDSVGIDIAKEIKNTLAKKSFKGESRLIVIFGEVTPEAQNSLLKILEELPLDTFFIFACQEELLATVISRCWVVKLTKSSEVTSKEVNCDDIKNLLSLSNINSGNILSCVDKLFEDKDKNSFARVVLQLREALRFFISENKISESKKIATLLASFLEYSELVLRNNLNQRVTAEKIMLRTLT